MHSDTDKTDAPLEGATEALQDIQKLIKERDIGDPHSKCSQMICTRLAEAYRIVVTKQKKQEEDMVNFSLRETQLADRENMFNQQMLLTEELLKKRDKEYNNKFALIETAETSKENVSRLLPLFARTFGHRSIQPRLKARRSVDNSGSRRSTILKNRRPLYNRLIFLHIP